MRPILVIKEGSGRMVVGSIVRAKDGFYCVWEVKGGKGQVYALPASWFDRFLNWVYRGEIHEWNG